LFGHIQTKNFNAYCYAVTIELAERFIAKDWSPHTGQSTL